MGRTLARMLWWGPGVRLGAHATLLPHVVLYPGVQAGAATSLPTLMRWWRETCVLGDHVTLENGAIVGSDGFGFAKDEAGHWEKIPPVGSGAAGQSSGCAAPTPASIGPRWGRRRLATGPR